MEMQKYETDHIDKVRKLSPECIVMLKSDGSFPLKNTGKIALYGSGARHTIKGGTGSGGINVKSYVTIEQGMKNAGFDITTINWMDELDAIRKVEYDKFRAELNAKGAAGDVKGVIEMIDTGAPPDPEYNINLKGEGEAAIYVLARNSGEGSDRKAEASDIKLTSTEIRDILLAAKKYPKFLLVLNVGGVVDLSPVVNQVKNILLLSQLGISTGDAFADVLLGKTYPSGKLASTWADWDDYSAVGDFGEIDDTRYREGVYVGYRYFDSVGKKPIFPFGFGLGYTTFSVICGNPTYQGSIISVPVTIKNTGSLSGKEVVQLYVSVPSADLDQPYQTLVAFQKTRELAPGKEEKLTLTFDMADLRSYDVKSSCRKLEPGNYIIRVGNSSRNTSIAGVVNLSECVNIEKVSHVGGTPDFEDWKPEIIKHNDDLTGKTVLYLSASDFKSITHTCPQIDKEALALAKTLSDNELAFLCTGAFKGEGSKNIYGSAALSVAGASGETTSAFSSKGVPNLIMADGPAGIRVSRQYGIDNDGVYAIESEGNLLFEVLPKEVIERLLKAFPEARPRERHGEIHEHNCTAIPIGTAIAQSWNPSVCEACGEVVGEEMKMIGIHLWLAPALNIHRNPLCGRNFEYFSEDPLISGKIAACISNSVQKHKGCGVTIKHFACNNQETNRLNSNSQVSERALRDIYLRGFEIAVKEAKPVAVMSSYNLLNGEHTSQRYDLMETVLREEWGFEGIVMSDWVIPSMMTGRQSCKYPIAYASGSIAAGNDIMMPGGKEHFEDILNAINNPAAKYSLSRENLEKCASRMISIAWKLAGKSKWQ